MNFGLLKTKNKESGKEQFGKAPVFIGTHSNVYYPRDMLITIKKDLKNRNISIDRNCQIGQPWP